MTKKSLSRIARDAEKARQEQDAKKLAKAQKALEGNTCWDDLNAIMNNCKQMLLTHANLGVELNRKDVLAELTDPKLVVQLINSLKNDLVQLTSELKEISKQHEDKIGGTDEPNVIIETIHIHEQYHLFMERHQAVVMPTVFQILENIQEAENKLIAKQAAAQREASLLDPNVTTDVEFKEVVAETSTETNEG